jgi:Cys-rich protein (TIGR01571 family)
VSECLQSQAESAKNGATEPLYPPGQPVPPPYYPYAGQPAVGTPALGWHTSLCGCFGDCGSCCLGFWCPCVLQGQNMEKLGQADACTGCSLWYLASIFGLCGCYAAGTRYAMRQQFGLHGSGCGACTAHTCCSGCAICQDAREIKYRFAQRTVAAGGGPTAPPPMQTMA